MNVLMGALAVLTFTLTACGDKVAYGLKAQGEFLAAMEAEDFPKALGVVEA